MSLIAQLSPLGFFAAGLAASGHCAMMCGPLIAMSAKRSTEKNDGEPPQLWLATLGPVVELQLGRVTSYTLLGSAAGLAGARFSEYVNPDSLANIRLGLLGLMMGLLALWLLRKPTSHQRCHASLESPQNRRSAWMRLPFTRGALLALLPCPLLFTVLIYCGLSASPLSGALNMLSFGIAGALLPSIAATWLLHWQFKYLAYSKAVAVVSLLGLGIGMTFFMSYLAPDIYCL